MVLTHVGSPTQFAGFIKKTITYTQTVTNYITLQVFPYNGLNTTHTHKTLSFINPIKISTQFQIITMRTGIKYYENTSPTHIYKLKIQLITSTTNMIQTMSVLFTNATLYI